MRNNETTNITLDKHESLKISKKLFYWFWQQNDNDSWTLLKEDENRTDYSEYKLESLDWCYSRDKNTKGKQSNNWALTLLSISSFKRCA